MSLKVAILKFSFGCEWITPNGPESIEDFVWKPLQAEGLCDFGCAINELNRVLSPHSFLNTEVNGLGRSRQVIIFIKNGNSTDDLPSAIKQIQKNKWFSRSIKIGFALSNMFDLDLFSTLVGNKEAIVRIDEQWCDIFDIISKCIGSAACPTGEAIYDD